MRNTPAPRDPADSTRAEIHALIDDFDSFLAQNNSRKSSNARPDPARLQVERRLIELVNARAR
ncbi:MAG: hypothetical protein QM766_09485 [Burkholderiaceae bacterium]